MVNHMYIKSVHTGCQVILTIAKFHRVGEWFNDSGGNIDFYKNFPCPSESTILNESMILYNL